jgi:hypothetical protein
VNVSYAARSVVFSCVFFHMVPQNSISRAQCKLCFFAKSDAMKCIIVGALQFVCTSSVVRF